jgi:hypothetical protein
VSETLDRDEVIEHFHQAVNMTAAELDRWLISEDSKAVGWKGEDGDGPGESVGHESGRRIVGLLGKKKADLTDDDVHHMQKVSGYVARHMAQRPAHPEESRWRYSLMNWGHDPMKKDRK